MRTGRPKKEKRPEEESQEKERIPEEESSEEKRIPEGEESSEEERTPEGEERPEEETAEEEKMSEEEREPGCCAKTKQRSPEEYRDLIHRLNRVEGQVRGIRGMIEKDAYCPDILVQVAAANAALNSFSKALLTTHIKTCVVDNIHAGNEEVIDELAALLQKLMK